MNATISHNKMPIAPRCGLFRQHFDKAGGLCLKFSYPQSHFGIDKPLFYLRIYDEHCNITMNATVSHNKMPAMIFAISQLPKVLSQITKNLRADYHEI